MITPDEMERELAFKEFLQKHGEPWSLKNLADQNEELKKEKAFLKYMAEPVIENLDETTEKSIRNKEDIMPPNEIERELAFKEFVQKHGEPWSLKNMRDQIKELQKEHSFLKYMVEPVIANSDETTKKSTRDEEGTRMKN
ncbi:uncharacterized protein LOC135837704 isoform X2 [Planococcus citri]